MNQFPSLCHENHFTTIQFSHIYVTFLQGEAMKKCDCHKQLSQGFL